MLPADLDFASAVDLAASIRQRKISPVEVVRSLLQRLEQVNPLLNAYVTVHADEALAAASHAEQAVQRGETVGPLHGVPLHVKDNLYVANSRTTFGSRLLEQNVTTADCPAVERLRAAGMILIGRTNSPEYGWKGVCDNRVFGATCNPWDRTRTSGGSSGGAAAAVAAGLGPVGLGTDGGGSLRIPASFCGVCGFKASFGRIPNWPGSGGAILRHIGTITRSVADQAACLSVLGGSHPRDLLSLSGGPVDYLATLEAGVRGRRIAYSADLGYATVDPEVAQICRQSALRLREAGAVVEEVALKWDDPYPAWSVFFFGSAAAALEAKLPQHAADLDPGLLRVVERGLELRGTDFANALAARHALWEQVAPLYEQFDLLLTPTLPVPAFALGQDDADAFPGEELGPLQWTRFSYPFNLTGQPAATVPAGWTAAGLPVGLQIVGNRYADGEVLQAAYAFEQLQPWA